MLSSYIKKYEINRDSCHLRFRVLETPADESPQELYTHLKDLFCKWVDFETLCYNCGEVGHTHPVCLVRKYKATSLCNVPRPEFIVTPEKQLDAPLVTVQLDPALSFP